MLGPLLHEPVTEVIVVDDESTDRTARLAGSFGCRVVTGAPLPDGLGGQGVGARAGPARGDAATGSSSSTPTRARSRGLIAALVEAAAPVDLVSAGPRFVVRRLRRAAAAPGVPRDHRLPLRAARRHGLAAVEAPRDDQRAVRRRPAGGLPGGRRLGARARQDDRGPRAGARAARARAGGSASRTPAACSRCAMYETRARDVDGMGPVAHGPGRHAARGERCSTC